MDIGMVFQFIKIGQQIVEHGKPAWNSVKGALDKHGISVDTAVLNDIIVDAAHRKLIAEREAKGETQDK
jgi:hypothetical protein